MPEVQLTEAGRRDLEERLEYLKSVRRAEIAEEIKTARGFGDLSENAVGTAEADFARGRISDESPIGSALINAQQGDLVEVPLPNGKIKRLKVLRVVR